MKQTLLIFIFLLCISRLFAQYQYNIIECREGSPNTFSQNGKILSMKELTEIIRTNPDAYQQLELAKSNKTFAYILEFSAGYLMGYPLSQSVAGGKGNWSMFGIGAGLFCLSIPFTSGHPKRLDKAIKIYNQQYQTGLNNVDFKLNLTANGIGIKMNF